VQTGTIGKNPGNSKEDSPELLCVTGKCVEKMIMSIIPRYGRRYLPISLLSSLYHQSRIIFADKTKPVSNTLTEIYKTRLNKISEMKAADIIPSEYSYPINTTAAEIKEKYSPLLAPGQEETTADISIAGRIMIRRFFGKLAFFSLQDHTDSIQLYIDKGRLQDHFQSIQSWTDNGDHSPCAFVALILLLLSSGDIIGVTGTIKKTDKGELSIYLKSWTMLSKALLPLPEKYHGLTDVETRYRNRHVDMIVNKQVVNTLRKRSMIIQSIRRSKSSPDVTLPDLT
jgi:lysyl-tRNA synthetase, class II